MIHTLRNVFEKLKMDKNAFFQGVSEGFFDYKIDGGDFWGWKAEETRDYLYFKNSVKAMSFPMIWECVPKLTSMNWENNMTFLFHPSMSWKDLENIPYFTFDLEKIQQALSEGRPVGVEGGPCLFGAWEVFMDLILDDGSVITYDFNAGKRVVTLADEKAVDGNTADAGACVNAVDFPYNCDYDLSAPDLAEAVKELGSHIVDIEFRDCKDGLTGQEFYSVKYLFEAGKALGARVVLSLPDMSYVKFLSSVLEGLPDLALNLQNQPGQAFNLKEQTIARFRKLAYRITDLYLDLAEKLSQEYPEVLYQPVHEREAELCRIYYEKRAPFIERNCIIRKISHNQIKMEALKDYISLSALPFYLYGIKDVLHICSLDEADSYRKCRKAHKAQLNLACILYPEYMSADGENTVFYAKKQYKDYLGNL